MCETLAAPGRARAGGSGDQIGVFTYDGDTPQDARRTIRARAHLVLSNPDMLHSGILPHHPRWAKLFENLRYVVIDELHAYRGVFGSHLCNVLRRLRRVCRHYGSDPVFICSSATIANPRELAERLAERPFELVAESGAPRGEKFFVFVNPPVVNHQLGIRRSYLGETRRIAAEFLKRHLQLIVFAQSRLATEILTTYLKDDFEGEPGAPERIRGYRGGYLPNRRREIEKGLREGAVRAVVSTNALELGIDIGALDVSVMAGYPGTIAATWQRAGRAGRRASRSAAVMVASSAPLDQFIVRNPSYFFDASPERALIDPDNLHILVDHIKCAAFEMPFSTTEAFGRHDLQEILGLLAEQGLVHRTGPADDLDGPAGESQWMWTNESYPADAVSLRSISSDNFVIVDTTRETRVIGETDFTSGPGHASSEGDLHRRRAAVSGGAPRLRGAQGVRARDRLRLLHDRHHLSARDDPRYVCRGWTASQRRSPRRLAGGGVQEDQVLHQRERRLRRARSARAADAHDVVLAHDSGRDMAMLPYAADDRRDGVVGIGVRHSSGRPAAADVRRARHRHLDRHGIGQPPRSNVQRTEIAEPPATKSRSGHSVHSVASVVSTSSTKSPQIFIYDNYPGRHRLQRAAVAHARRAAVRHAPAHRGMRMRERMPGLRRADRRHRSVGEDRGASNPGSVDGATTHCRHRGSDRGEA